MENQERIKELEAQVKTLQKRNSELDRSLRNNNHLKEKYRLEVFALEREKNELQKEVRLLTDKAMQGTRDLKVLKAKYRVRKDHLKDLRNEADQRAPE